MAAMRLLILGAGAVGGYFGGRLAQAGADVTFLVRPQRAALIARDGLVIKSPRGDAVLQVKATTADTVRPDYDLVLLTCKAYDLDDAIAAITGGMSAQTTIVPLLNGMRHLDVLDARFGEARVLGGVARIASTLGPKGEVVHTSPFAGLSTGERKRGTPPRRALEALAAAMKAASIDGGLHADIIQDMWDKWIMLCSLAAMTSLMRANTGEILSADEGEAVMRETVAECQKVAVAEGHDPAATGLGPALANLTTRGSKFAASMLRDIEKGNRVEASHVVGDMIARARRAGVVTPNLRLALVHLQAYEAHLGVRPIA
jgi:2-dehydropantoate 2-reductase